MKTVADLAMELITHSETKPGIIGTKEAEHIISMLDKSVPLPPELTPETLQKEWNYIVLFDLPDELWD